MHSKKQDYYNCCYSHLQLGLHLKQNIYCTSPVLYHPVSFPSRHQACSGVSGLRGIGQPSQPTVVSRISVLSHWAKISLVTPILAVKTNPIEVHTLILPLGRRIFVAISCQVARSSTIVTIPTLSLGSSIRSSWLCLHGSYSLG